MKLVDQQGQGNDESEPHVLVVEDYADLGIGLVRLLGRRGVPALHVQNARAALHMLEARAVSVVVADLQMPERDGLSLLAEVARRWPKCPRVLYTGHANSDLILNGRGVRVLSKSLDLGLVIDQLVALHRSFVV